MITCHRFNLESKAKHRGYALAEVMSCVVAQDGDQWTIDIDHPSYPKHAKIGFVFVPPLPESAHQAPQARGPGTELRLLLAAIRIKAAPDCKCNKRAAYMDKMEAEQPGWCEAHIDEIVGWLRESAAERGLPFLDVAGRVLVRRAIANARRKEAQ